MLCKTLLETWIETYRSGDIRVADSDTGNPPDVIYRIMSENEFDGAIESGFFKPRPGQRIHASEEPLYRYAEPGKNVLVTLSYHDEDGWKAKWGMGGDELYVITDQPISTDRIVKVEHFEK